MYEALTDYIKKLESNASSVGEWDVDNRNDGTPEHPIQIPYVDYSVEAIDLMDEIQTFVDEHEDLELTNYGEILEKHGIEWGTDSMMGADVSESDAITVLALLVGAYRADRFCEGAFLSFCESGTILNWLKRLDDLDVAYRKEKGLVLIAENKSWELRNEYMWDFNKYELYNDKSLHIVVKYYRPIVDCVVKITDDDYEKILSAIPNKIIRKNIETYDGDAWTIKVFDDNGKCKFDYGPDYIYGFKPLENIQKVLESYIPEYEKPTEQ